MSKKGCIIIIVGIILALGCALFCVISLLSGYKYWHDYPEIDGPTITEEECKEKIDKCFEKLSKGEEIECDWDSCERFKHGGRLYFLYDKKSECADTVDKCLIRKERGEDITYPKNCDYYTKYNEVKK